MSQNPYEIFQKKCPDVAARFNDLIKAQKAFKGFDDKTKQLIYYCYSDCEPKSKRRTDACNDGKK